MREGYSHLPNFESTNAGKWRKKIVGVNSEFRNVESKGRKKLCKKLNDKNANIDLFLL